MAGEKYNIQLEAAEIFNRLVKVPELVQGLNELLQNFNSPLIPQHYYKIFFLST